MPGRHQADLNLRVILNFASVAELQIQLGGLLRRWGVVWMGFIVCGGLCAQEGCSTQLLVPAAAAASSSFLKDAARYLTGSEADAEKVWEKFRRGQLPYPKAPKSIPIPETFETLLADLGFHKGKPYLCEERKWVVRRVVKSRAKGLDRVIYRRRVKKGEAGVSIAQTVDSAGFVRETEVSVQRHGSRDRDFFVFDEEGRRVESSTFISSSGLAVTAPAPFACLACHYNAKTHTFGVRPRSYPFSEKFVLELEQLSYRVP